MSENLPDRVVRLFKDFFSGPESQGPPPRLDHLPFALHLIASGSSVELFPPGPLDVLRFNQRHHSSIHHELEYVVCVPIGAAPEDHGAYAVVRLRPEDELPLESPAAIEKMLRASYGTFVRVPRARPLLENQYSDDLTDEDPPEGLNRVLAPTREKAVPGRMSTAEVLDIMRKELKGPELIAWLEGAFRQPPRKGTVEHRYYLDGAATLYLVRDHFADGKKLYRAHTSAAALRPERR
jgi:hypothetical protein